MNYEFDRQKFLKNVQTVMEQRGVKANELESELGLYAGYISRLKGTDDKVPPLDVAWKMAKYLGVGTESLVEGNFDVTSESLEYIRSFLQRVYSQSLAGKIEWIRTTVWEINQTMRGEEKKWVPAMEYDSKKDFGNCYFDQEARMEGHETGSYLSAGHWRIKSFMTSHSSVWVEESCYHFEMKPDQRLYLIPYACVNQVWIDPEDPEYGTVAEGIKFWYELLIATKKEGSERTITPICSNLGPCEVLSTDIEQLYQEAKRCVSFFRIHSSARSMIDGFMRDTNPVCEGNKIPKSDQSDD